MRHSMLTTTFVLSAGFAVSCVSADGKSPAEPKDHTTAAVQLDKAKTETQGAAQATRDYVYAQKADFVDKMKRNLVEIYDELDRLSAKVDKSSGAARVDAKTKLDAVHEQWTQAKMHLDRVEGATESTWDEVKGGCQKSYRELKGSLEDSRQWLSEKIAP